jgi:hypothetical protein
VRGVNNITGKYRVPHGVVDDAVHQLALMCVQSSIKDTHLDPVDLPNLVADQYCIASEMIRKRINQQRLMEGIQTGNMTVCEKTWFNQPVKERLLIGPEEFHRP